MHKEIKKLSVNILAVVSLVAIIISAMAFVLAGGFNNPLVVRAEVISDMRESYSQGEEFTIPESKITFNGKEYDVTESMIIYPDGNGYAKDKYILSDVGNYEVVFSSNIDGKTVSASKKFVVKKGIYEFMTDKSSFAYGPNAMDNRGATDGLNVKLADGDKFIFNKPIDLSTYTVEKPFVVIYPQNKIVVNKTEEQKLDQQGKPVFDKDGNPVMETKFETEISETYNEIDMFNVRLTDCYDPSVYIEYEINWVERDRWAYYRASANNQPKLGLWPNSTGVDIDGKTYKIRYDSGTTVGIRRAFNQPFQFRYDYKTSKAYAEDNRRKIQLVTQFNNKDIYNDNAFKGFTTGEVYLSVYGSNYSTSHMNFCIKELDGIKGENLKYSDVQDTKAPILNVDMRGGDSDSYVIAKNEEFTIFDSYANDLNLDNAYGIKKTIYYNYGTAQQTQINLVNDKFVPERTGEYTLVYTARDTFGNVAKKCISLNCSECENDNVIKFATDNIKSLNAGEKIQLPEYVLKGVNGNVFMNIYAMNLRTNEKVAINKDTREFVPDDVCEYEIIYEYGDCIQNYKYSYKVNSLSSDFTIFNKKPANPLYVIKGMNYTFDKVTVNTFTGNAPEEKDTKLFVKQDDGQFIEADPNKVFISATSSITLKYVYNDWEYVCPVIPVMNVKNDEDLMLQEYFAGDFTKTTLSDCLRYVSNAQSGNQTLNFINPVSMGLFEFQCRFVKDISLFDSMTVTLTDFYNRDNHIEIKYTIEDEMVKLSIDQSKSIVTCEQAYGKEFGLYYLASSSAFVDLDGRIILYDNMFATDKALVSITFNNIHGQAGAELLKINNCMLNDLTFDISEPQIIVPEKASGLKKKEEIIKISPAIYTDVLSPVVLEDLSMMVKDPDGDFVKSVDGITLDGTNDTLRNYEIKLTKYGSYIITYKASDQNGKDYIYSYYVVVVNQTPPEIKIEGVEDEDYVINVKLNDKVSLPQFSVSDDNTSVENIETAVIVVSPTNEMVKINDFAFIADVKGEYNVSYYAYDSDGNYSIKVIKVVCE